MKNNFLKIMTLGKFSILLIFFAGSISLSMAETKATVDESPCKGIESPSERLACYDRQASQAESEGSLSLAEEAARTEMLPIVTEENFGIQKEVVEEELVTLTSTISKLEQLQLNRYLIFLENGQVWRQMESQRYRMRVGQEVSIKPSRWGKSFRLSSKNVNSFVQVERVK